MPAFLKGGAGFLLNKQALNKIGQKLKANYSFCTNTGIEDQDVSKCLQKLNVSTINSVDHLGRERFHPYLKIRNSNF